MNKLFQRIKQSFINKKFKSGAYSAGISVFVIAVIVFANIISNQLNLKIDLSKDDKYSLTSQTKNMIKDISDEIKLYYMAGEDSQDIIVKQIVDQYDGIVKNIEVEMKDPVLYPQFASKYSDDEVAANSVLVVNSTNGRNKVVNYNDMLVTEIDYNTYTEQTTGIDVEGQITSAIEYVTTKDLPVMYQVEGHGELEISTSLAISLAKENINTEKLNTLTGEVIPEDCDILLINGPQHDFTKEETSMIREYLMKGGDAIILTSYSTEIMPNFEKILAAYGVTMEEGIVVEGDNSHFMSGTPTYLIPNINHHDITAEIIGKNMPVVVPVGKGLKISKSLEESIAAESLLDSTDASYSKVDVNSSTYTKEEADIRGPFSLGIAIIDSKNNSETKLAVFSSQYLIDDSMVRLTSLGNTDIFLNSIKWITGAKAGLSIPSRSLEPTFLSLNAAAVNFYSGLVLIVIPFVILITGVIVTIRRRKK